MRRARCLASFWEGRDFITVNYLTGTETVLSPLAAALVGELDDYVAVPSLERRVAALPRGGASLKRLISQHVLLVKGSPLDARDRLVAGSWEWGPSARFFHFATQSVPYDEDPFEGRSRLAAHARQVPPPAPYKETGGRRLRLSGGFGAARGELWEVLRKRRTVRRFARAPVSREALEQVLLWTWGRTHHVENRGIGSYILKTSPSGGARHPIETYVLVRRVTGIAPGVYHYSVKRHALEYLRAAPSPDRLVTLLAHQPWVRNAPVAFFMTAVVNRSMWKYKHPHAYRVLLLDAGHLGQTFHLVCTALGLGPFTSSAKDDKAIEQLLGIDGVKEISLYAAALGIPARQG